jgi:hypothetical protein
MSRGDVHVFANGILKTKAGVALNLTSDTLKLGIVGNGVVPTVSTADPRWGSSGSTDFSAQDMGHATAYTGPITLASATYTRTSGVDTLAAANVTVNQDASGFTTAYYGIIYDDTVAGKYALAFVDLGGPVSIVGGALNINWNASGICQETCS